MEGIVEWAVRHRAVRKLNTGKVVMGPCRPARSCGNWMGHSFGLYLVGWKIVLHPAALTISCRFFPHYRVFCAQFSLSATRYPLKQKYLFHIQKIVYVSTSLIALSSSFGINGSSAPLRRHSKNVSSLLTRSFALPNNSLYSNPSPPTSQSALSSLLSEGLPVHSNSHAFSANLRARFVGFDWVNFAPVSDGRDDG